MAPPVFGRAAITLGIGPHSTLLISGLEVICVAANANKMGKQHIIMIMVTIMNIIIIIRWHAP